MLAIMIHASEVARFRPTVSKDGNELSACFYPSRRSALRAEVLRMTAAFAARAER
jgi:hypothetical protein